MYAKSFSKSRVLVVVFYLVVVFVVLSPYCFVSTGPEGEQKRESQGEQKRESEGEDQVGSLYYIPNFETFIKEFGATADDVSNVSWSTAIHSITKGVVLLVNFQGEDGYVTSRENTTQHAKDKTTGGGFSRRCAFHAAFCCVAYDGRHDCARDVYCCDRRSLRCAAAGCIPVATILSSIDRPRCRCHESWDYFCRQNKTETATSASGSVDSARAMDEGPISHRIQVLHFSLPFQHSSSECSHPRKRLGLRRKPPDCVPPRLQTVFNGCAVHI